MRINIYRHTFAVLCPANAEQIIYRLEIQSKKMIYAEDIYSQAIINESEYHEALADRLYAYFGERQTIIATHHGVEIETRRGFE